MKKASRGISLILAALMAGLVSCGGTTDDPKDTKSGGTTTEVESGGSDLPTFTDERFDGREFRILRQQYNYSCYNFEYQTVEAENADLMNDAIYKRNLLTEEKYGVKITERTDKDLLTSVRKSINSQDDDFDVCFIRAEAMQAIIEPNMFLDFNTLPNIDLDRPWWDQNARREFSVNGKLLFMTSDMLITHYETGIILFFNKVMADQFGIADIYDTVRKGEWTLDKYEEVTKNVKIDLNNDGKYNKDDQWAMCGWYGVTVPQWYIGAGVNTVGKDTSDNLVLKADSAEFEKVFDRITTILGEAKVTNPDKNEEHLLMFQQDQSLFFSGCVGEAKEFREMKNDFGVIPAPKYDASQENYAVYSNFPINIMVPVTVSDKNMVGALLEYLSYQGSEVVIPKFYETMIQTKYLRDTESVEMLDKYVSPNLVYNIGTDILGQELGGINKLPMSGNTSITTYMAKNGEKIKSQIEKYSECFG